ncbi:MAG: hypothetical protein ACFCGT_23860 [Sandaracinaceae bacterium]
MPYLGSTVFVATVALSFLLALNAWWLLCRALAPRFVARAQARFRDAPGLTLLTGAGLGGACALAASLLALAPHPAAKLLGTAALPGLAAFALAGAAGLAGRIGEGLATPADRGRAWVQVLRGGAVLELSFLLPLFGWFVIAPLALVGGFGAALGALAGSVAARLGASSQRVAVADAP